MARFRAFAERYPAVGDVRGRGAMCAIELVTDRGTKEPLGADAMNAIVRRCLENGVIVLTAGTYGNVRQAPAAAHDRRRAPRGRAQRAR